MAAIFPSDDLDLVYRVSILVLLDWEWRPLMCMRPGEVAVEFQSLFCWIGNGGTHSHDRPGSLDVLFQSLFCWIGNGGT